MHPSKSIHVGTNIYRQMLTAEEPDTLEFPEEIVNSETRNNIAIQKVAAKNGIIPWDEFLKKLKTMNESCDWNVVDLQQHVEKRPFLFKDWDRYHGPGNLDFYQFLLVQFIAKILLNSPEEKMEINLLNERLTGARNIFKNRDAADIQYDLIGIVYSNKNVFDLVSESEDSYCGEETSFVRLTNEAKSTVALWYECAIDVIRGEKEDQNIDESRKSIVFGTLDGQNENNIKFKVLKYFALQDPNPSYAVVNKDTIEMAQKNFDARERTLVACEAVRIGWPSENCKYLAKLYRPMYDEDKEYDEFPMRVFNVLDKPNGRIKWNAKGEYLEDKEEVQKKWLMKLKEVIGESFVIPGVITFDDIVAICQDFDFEAETVRNFIYDQCHLYEIVEEGEKFKLREKGQVEKLVQLIEVIERNCDVPSEKIDLGISEEEFNKLWPILNGKYEVTENQEGSFVRFPQKLVNGIFMDI